MTKRKKTKPLIMGHVYEYFEDGESCGKVIFIRFSSNTTSTVKWPKDEKTFQVNTHKLRPIDSIIR